MKNYLMLLLLVTNISLWATPFDCFSELKNRHPIFVDVEIFNYNRATQTFEITLRFFIDDAQKILNEKHIKTDFYTHEDTAIIQQIYHPYIQNNLKILANEKFLSLDWIGYERENGSVLFYLESHPILNPKDIQIQSTLLCGYFNQSHIVEIHINNKIFNSKLDCQNSIFKTQF